MPSKATSAALSRPDPTTAAASAAKAKATAERNADPNSPAAQARARSAVKLTPQGLNAAQPDPAGPYKLNDPAVPGLYVIIQKKFKTFGYSFRFGGTKTEMTLGRYPSISLTEAREAAEAARRAVERGENPAKTKAAKKAQERKTAAPIDADTFRRLSEEWTANKLTDDLADSYKAQIQSRLDRFVLGVIGDKAFYDVTPSDVLEIIKPIQAETPGTAEGVRNIIERIYQYAIHRDQIIKPIDRQKLEQNPAFPLRGFYKVPKSVPAPHLKGKAIGVFWNALARQTEANPSTIAATKLLIYSMARKSEVRLARWSEFDLDAGVWEIPAERIKTRLPHNVYLSRQAVDMLRVQHALTGHLEYCFPSAFRSDVPIAECTINHLFKRLGVDDSFSPHGTRSTFGTLLLEAGEKPVLVELLLAHAVKGIAAHYHRHELVADRKRALQWIADEVDRLARAAAMDGVAAKKGAKAVVAEVEEMAV